MQLGWQNAKEQAEHGVEAEVNAVQKMADEQAKKHAEEQAENVADAQKQANDPPEYEAEVTAEETSTIEPVDSKKHPDEIAAVAEKVKDEEIKDHQANAEVITAAVAENAVDDEAKDQVAAEVVTEEAYAAESIETVQDRVPETCTQYRGGDQQGPRPQHWPPKVPTSKGGSAEEPGTFVGNGKEDPALKTIEKATGAEKMAEEYVMKRKLWSWKIMQTKQLRMKNHRLPVVKISRPRLLVVTIP